MLTDAAIRRAKPKARAYKLYDAHGLSLVIPPTGRPRWRFDFRLAGKRRTMSLGVYPDVSLETARKRLAEARSRVADDTDPVRARRIAKVAAGAAVRLRGLAQEWFRVRTKGLSTATVVKKRLLLDNYILPDLGGLRVRDIRPADVLLMLRRIEADGHHETARRVRQITGEILRYGVATDQAERDVTPDLSDALVPAPISHRAALTEPRQVAELLRAIHSMRETPQLRSALLLLAYTFVRPGELRTAEWTEVNLADAVWRIPGRKTKQRAAHVVPLSTQAIAEFSRLKALASRSRYVLPTPRTHTRPLSNAAFTAALARIGYGSDVMTPHGFRAMARTLLDEQLHEPPDVIEAQLAHVTRGPLGDTYNRSRYLSQRTAMMQRWSDYLDSLGRVN